MTTAAIDARRIPLSLLDEPAMAMRETMDDDALALLVLSIKANGLVEPIVVRPKNGRYEVIAGHRRMVACARAGVLDPLCLVRDVDDRTVEALKVAENVDRENVNAADEATYFAELLARYCHDDVDELCEMTKRNRTYVESRLLLLRGFPQVLALLRRGEISLSVAVELNRAPDEKGLLLHLDAAKNGASARQVRQWIVDYKNFCARQTEEFAAAVNASGETAPAPIVTGPRCPVCRDEENANRLIVLYVHDYCQKAILEKLLRAYHGESPVVNS